MIERTTREEKLRYIAAAVELGGLCKVKWWFIEFVGWAARTSVHWTEVPHAVIGNASALGLDDLALTITAWAGDPPTLRKTDVPYINQVEHAR